MAPRCMPSPLGLYRHPPVACGLAWSALAYAFQLEEGNILRRRENLCLSGVVSPDGLAWDTMMLGWASGGTRRQRGIGGRARDRGVDVDDSGVRSARSLGFVALRAVMVRESRILVSDMQDMVKKPGRTVPICGGEQ